MLADCTIGDDTAVTFVFRLAVAFIAILVIAWWILVGTGVMVPSVPGP